MSIDRDARPPARPPARTPGGDRRRVVIIGGGFGGMEAARRLKRAGVAVTIIDRHNHLLFQPLI
jgi:NADH:ubiquinone reductase (H+-translocating)